MRLPSRIDIDSLAQDIWCEAWINKTPITAVLIRHRAINSLKRLRQDIEDFNSVSKEAPPDITPEVSDEVHLLMAQAALNTDQISMVYYSFYRNMTQAQISKQLNWSRDHVSEVYQSTMSRLREVGRIIEGSRS